MGYGAASALELGEASSFTNFVALITRQHCGSGKLVNAAKYAGGSPLDRILALAGSFGLLAGLLLLSGAVHAYRTQRWYFWFSMLAFAFAGQLFAAYANMNISADLSRFVLERFFLLSHVILAPLMAFGVLLGAELLGSAFPRMRTHAGAAVAAIVLLAVLGSVIANYHEMDQSANHVARRSPMIFLRASILSPCSL